MARRTLAADTATTELAELMGRPTGLYLLRVQQGSARPGRRLKRP